MRLLDRNQDVLRLDVSMEESMSMNVLQSRNDLISGKN